MLTEGPIIEAKNRPPLKSLAIRKDHIPMLKGKERRGKKKKEEAEGDEEGHGDGHRALQPQAGLAETPVDTAAQLQPEIIVC
jgi:hypothetical protein